MSLRTRYVAVLLGPPLVVLPPVAFFFLSRVLMHHAVNWTALSGGVASAYLFGAVIAATVLNTNAARVERALAEKRDVDQAVSSCLESTVAIAFLYWVVWGGLLVTVAAALVLPTILGIQYFSEAVLLIAVPAMSWTYWAAKDVLLAACGDVQALRYTGRLYSVRVKITLVFIGFFAASVGAIVLLISATVASRLGEDMAQEITRNAIWIVIATSLAFATATYFLARDVTRPLRALSRLAGEMAEGRFDRPARIFADDEIGQVALSFGTTREKLRTLVARVGTRGSAITEGVRMMTDGTDTLVRGALDQTGLVTESDAAVGQVRREARSVLGAVEQVETRTIDTANRATELRASAAEVAKQMDDLFGSLTKSTTGTNEIEAAAREMSRRTSDLSNISSEVLAFVSEMDSTVQQINQTASATADLSRAMRVDADRGRGAVDQTVEGILRAQESTRRTVSTFEELQQSLGKIDQVLVFIDEVTNRTNLLSFNAAIIAAQAGENDSGFSVIADEIRQLADRTREATKEIAAIVRGVQPIARGAVKALGEGVATVDRSVELATEASAALAQIVGSADRSLDMSRGISTALQEQSNAGRHLHSLASNLSDTVAEIHRATEGQEHAIHLLAVEADLVHDIAYRVQHAAHEQVQVGEGISAGMEHVAADIHMIRERLESQLLQAESIANASQLTLTIAEKNSTIAEQFSSALQSLVQTGHDFELEVGRFAL